MYKKILSINGSQATSGGLNKAENVSSTITLKDLKTPSPMSSANSVHHHQQQPSDEVEASDESNFTIESAVNSSDKVICEQRPLATSIPSSSPSNNVPLSPTPPPTLPLPPPSKMEIDDYSSVQTYPTHKSIHHTATVHYRDMMVDENLENKQQNFVVNEEDDVWRPW